MDAEQAIQSVSIDLFEQINCSASVQQVIQSVNISTSVAYQSAIQSLQRLSAIAYEQINANGIAAQSSQSLSATLWYYDIGIEANIVQPSQSMASVGFIKIAATLAIQQSPQLLNAYGTSQVITPPTALNTMSRDRILRNIRNKGSR